MLVQVITAHTSDPAGLRHQGERWSEDVRRAAEGFLGATIGTANDGTTFALVRFKDEAAALANSDRPEQRAWWKETAKYYDLECRIVAQLRCKHPERAAVDVLWFDD
jgi:hypothetical protein